MQQSIVKFYCFVVQTLLNMFRSLLCPSSRARPTAVVRQSNKILRLIVASSWVFYLCDWRCTEPQTLNSLMLNKQEIYRVHNGNLTGSWWWA